MSISKQVFYKQVRENQEKKLKSFEWQSCLNCEYWQEIPMSGKTFQCYKFKAIPPPDFIVHGCEEWEEDIPF